MKPGVTYCARTVCLILLFAACTGTDIGNAPELDVTLYNETLASSVAPATSFGAGSTVVSLGWVSLSNIRFRSAANCEGDSEFELAGPFAVDLFDPGSLSRQADFQIPFTDYCRVEIKWDAHDGPLPMGAPAELAGAAILLKGSRSDGIPFLVQSQEDGDLLFNASNGAFSVSESTNTLIVGFDGLRLFSGIDLNTAVVDPDDVIRISPTSNENLLSIFEQNLDTAGDLFDDDDGDGALDTDERDEEQDKLAD